MLLALSKLINALKTHSPEITSEYSSCYKGKLQTFLELFFYYYSTYSYFSTYQRYDFLIFYFPFKREKDSDTPPFKFFRRGFSHKHQTSPPIKKSQLNSSTQYFPSQLRLALSFTTENRSTRLGFRVPRGKCFPSVAFRNTRSSTRTYI